MTHSDWGGLAARDQMKNQEECKAEEGIVTLHQPNSGRWWPIPPKITWQPLITVGKKALIEKLNEISNFAAEGSTVKIFSILPCPDVISAYTILYYIESYE